MEAYLPGLIIVPLIFLVELPAQISVENQETTFLGLNSLTFEAWLILWFGVSHLLQLVGSWDGESRHVKM